MSDFDLKNLEAKIEKSLNVLKELIDVEDVQKKLQNFNADIEISKNKVLHKC